MTSTWTDGERCRYKLSVIPAFLWLILANTIQMFKWIFRRPKHVNGQTVVITGCAQGIGLQTARLFALKHNANVFMLDMNEEKVREAANDIRGYGGFAHALVCDVTCPESMNEAAAQIFAHPRGKVVDILVCNAGVLLLDNIVNISKERMEKTFAVNVNGVLWAMQAFLPAMKRRRSGQIVAISSCAGHVGEALGGAYSASKHAVIGLMDSLQCELQDEDLEEEIKLTTVCPYFVDTAMVAGLIRTLSPELAASEIVKAILLEKYMAIVPSHLWFTLQVLHPFLSQRANKILRSIGGARFFPKSSKQGQLS